MDYIDWLLVKLVLFTVGAFVWGLMGGFDRTKESEQNEQKPD